MSRALQGYLWVKTSESAVGLRMDSPWISSRYTIPCWRDERVENRRKSQERSAGFQH